MREKRKNIGRLITAKQNIALNENQVFYETLKAYEIWDTIPLRMVARISKKRVLWVEEK